MYCGKSDSAIAHSHPPSVNSPSRNLLIEPLHPLRSSFPAHRFLTFTFCDPEVMPAAQDFPSPVTPPSAPIPAMDEVPVCSVCTEEVWYGARTQCGHVFHTPCLDGWMLAQQSDIQSTDHVVLRAPCPSCRNTCDSSSVRYDYYCVLFLGQGSSSITGTRAISRTRTNRAHRPRRRTRTSTVPTNPRLSTASRTPDTSNRANRPGAHNNRRLVEVIVISDSDSH